MSEFDIENRSPKELSQILRRIVEELAERGYSVKSNEGLDEPPISVYKTEYI